MYPVKRKEGIPALVLRPTPVKSGHAMALRELNASRGCLVRQAKSNICLNLAAAARRGLEGHAENRGSGDSPAQMDRGGGRAELDSSVPPALQDPPAPSGRVE